MSSDDSEHDANANARFASSDIQQVFDQGDVLSPVVFDALSTVLAVQWPEWYRVVVQTLLERPPEWGDWLAGGFLYARPCLVCRDTASYRSGKLRIHRHGTFDDTLLPVTEWSPSYVVVGGTGSGFILIDTSRESPQFLIIDKDTYAISQFLDIAQVASSPESFARTLLAGR